MVTTALEAVLRFQPVHGQALVPALIGHTGAGKTRAARQAAEHLGLPIQTLLLGTMLPEDVLGLPRVARVGTRCVTEYTLPTWAANAIGAATVLLLDEIDKARPEVLTTVLTLISERRVHDHPLHANTVIVLAGQPPGEYWLQDTAAAALSARSVWLPITYDYAAIERLGGYDLSWSPRPAPPDLAAVVLPVPSPRQLLWLAQFRHHAAADDGVVRTVAAGVLPAALVPEFLSAPEVASADDQSYWALDHDRIDGYLAALAPSHLAAILEAPEAQRGDPARVRAVILALGRTNDADLRLACVPRAGSLCDAIGITCAYGPFGLVIDGVMVL